MGRFYILQDDSEAPDRQSYDGSNDDRSSLELFRVDAATGFEQVGSIDHSGLLGGLCPPSSYRECNARLMVQRGLFVEDYVHSISDGGVRMHRLDSMTEVASISLPR
jgi:hypothetical protein